MMRRLGQGAHRKPRLIVDEAPRGSAPHPARASPESALPAARFAGGRREAVRPADLQCVNTVALVGRTDSAEGRARRGSPGIEHLTDEGLKVLQPQGLADCLGFAPAADARRAGFDRQPYARRPPSSLGLRPSRSSPTRGEGNCAGTRRRFEALLQSERIMLNRADHAQPKSPRQRSPVAPTMTAPSRIALCTRTLRRSAMARATKPPGKVASPISPAKTKSGGPSAPATPKVSVLTTPMPIEMTASVAITAEPCSPEAMRIEISTTPEPVVPPASVP